MFTYKHEKILNLLTLKQMEVNLCHSISSRFLLRGEIWSNKLICLLLNVKKIYIFKGFKCKLFPAYISVKIVIST